MTITSNAVPKSNGSGAYSGNIIRRTGGLLQLTVTVANAANSVLPSFSGTWTANNLTNGTLGSYLTGGTLASLLGTNAASVWDAATTTPAAGKSSIGWNGSAYALYNNTGASVTYNVTLVIAREAV